MAAEDMREGNRRRKGKSALATLFLSLIVIPGVTGQDAANQADTAAGVTVLPQGWVSRDVGSPASTGSSSNMNGLYSVSSSGLGVAGRVDQFQFAYLPMAGDGEVAARVVSQTSKVPLAKAGVILRENRTPGASFAMMFLGPAGDIHFRYREHAGEVPSDVLLKVQASWLKVSRNGSTFTGYYSADGSIWKAAASAGIQMPPDLLAGLVSSSRDIHSSNIAKFDHVSVTRSNAAWDGTAAPVPGIVEAEHFDVGGIGWSYSPDFAKDGKGVYRTDDSVPIEAMVASAGTHPEGYFLSHMKGNRWINYSVQIAKEDNYVFTVRVASLGSGGTFHFNLDQVPVTKPMHIPDTGGWQGWQLISSETVHLPAGHHTIALVIDSAAQKAGAGNIDYFSIQVQ